mgnify:CR=1 FL=1
MAAILYIIASIFLGAGLILVLMPYMKNRLIPFASDKNSVSKNFLFFPAAYLVGTLILSWITYFLAVIFKNAENPLLYANLYAFLIVIACVFSIEQSLISGSTNLKSTVSKFLFHLWNGLYCSFLQLFGAFLCFAHCIWMGMLFE